MVAKKILLWTTIGASVLLTGTTFAAWVVTDTANPFNITITPETPTIVTDRKAVLEWGEMKAVDFHGIKSGETKGAYEIGLKATTNTSEAYTGSFEVKMTDDHPSNNTNKLINNLTVEVYDKEVNEAGAAKILTVDKNHASEKATVEVSSGVTKTVYLYVTLAQLESEVMDEIKNDSVTLTVDWNKAEEDDALLADPIYTSKIDGWGENLYAYAWNSASDEKNAEWPGVAMTAVEGTNYYKYDLGTGYDRVIFTDNEGKQTDNLEITTAVRLTTPYYDLSEKKWYTPQQEQVVEYYVTGTINGVNKWYTAAGFVNELKMTPAAGEDAELNIAVLDNLALKPGDEIKVISNVLDQEQNPQYFGNPENDGNVVIEEDALYKIFLNKQFKVYAEKKAA
ncbi:MAG: starch-binding protein [Bacilli bacterium]|nr:starch-binding protein [Bacilli bacterium]